MKLYTAFKAVYKIIDIELMPIRNNKISIPLSKNSKLCPKLNKLPMQLKIAIVLKNKEKRTAITTMVSHAILILRSLMTSLMNLVIFFISFTCMRLFWLRDEFLIHGQYAAHKDYKHDGY